MLTINDLFSRDTVEKAILAVKSVTTARTAPTAQTTQNYESRSSID